VQIFASDIDEAAIEAAGKGLYPDSIDGKKGSAFRRSIWLGKPKKYLTI
jgi:chemotaxis methyl-accepting protein methylase